MRILLGLLLGFSLISPVFAETCPECQNQQNKRGRFNPPPKAQPDVTKKGEKGDPGPQGMVGIPGLDGKNGKDGLPGRDGRDVDPTLLQGIQNALTETQKSNSAIAEKLASLEQNLQATVRSNELLAQQFNQLKTDVTDANTKLVGQLRTSYQKMNTQITTIQTTVDDLGGRVNALNEKLAGKMKVRFTYDPKTGSLIPSN